MRDMLLSIDPMGLILFTLPLIAFCVGLVAQLVSKKRIIILGVIFTVNLILTFAVFNSTFFIYCFIYTGIAELGTLLADLITNLIKKGSVRL
ncbi:DUF2651 family protein [Clostridium sp.]